MLVYLCRALTRLVALATLPVLAAIAGLFTVAAIVRPSQVHRWAHESRLTSSWQHVGTFLRTTAPSGDTAAVLGASGAVLLGVALLIGALAPLKQRDLVLDADGELTVRRRALRQAAASVASVVPGAATTRVRLRARRRRAGGRLRVTARPAPGGEVAALREAIATGLEPLSGPFALRVKVRGRAQRQPKVRPGR